MMLSCYRDDSCRVGSELFEIELRFLSRGRPAGIFFEMGTPSLFVTRPQQLKISLKAPTPSFFSVKLHVKMKNCNKRYLLSADLSVDRSVVSRMYLEEF